MHCLKFDVSLSNELKIIHTSNSSVLGFWLADAMRTKFLHLYYIYIFLLFFIDKKIRTKTM